MGKLTGKSPLSRILIRRLRNYLGLLLAGLMILSCAGYTVRGDRPRGVYHRVKSGETLLMIARTYQVNLRELAEINKIENPNRIEVDSVILIPDAPAVLDIVATARPQTAPPPPTPPATTPPSSPPPVAAPTAVEAKASPPPPRAVSKPETPAREAPVPRKRPDAPTSATTVRDRPEPAAPAENGSLRGRPSVKPEKEETAVILPKPEREEVVRLAPKPEPREAAAPAARTGEGEPKVDQIQSDKKRFVWPVRGKIISRFGTQPNRINNNGIWIAAGEGSVVVAAADGVVDRSIFIKGYGETIIILHDAHYATVYAHLGIRAVQTGTRVKKGERIGFLGKDEPPDEPYLHFEIRQKSKAQNPLFFLP
ncbi:MAG: peptidoglycan DD-metalloendopeptidase family protein [Deltaproteobacteria bacterium]|nr:peptidoglycan DD-metalloendopeptidase family protein [Deltaproteobacteria bacterium]